MPAAKPPSESASAKLRRCGGKKKPAGAPTKRTPEAAARIVEILGVGGTWAMAAAAAGISDDTLKRWRDDDADFAASCARARDAGASKLVDQIRQAAEAGDVRAAMWLLERIKPEEYGRRTLVSGDPAGAAIRVDAELKAGAAIRGNPGALRKLRDAISSAVSKGDS